MNVLLSIVSIILLVQVSLIRSIPVIFTWENHALLPNNIYVKTTTEFGFSDELSCVQNSHTIDMNLEWVKAITHVTITWNEDKKTFPIAKEDLPTDKVNSWTINLQ